MQKKLLFENSHPVNQITLIQMNLPILALGFVITVHIATYECRQTLAEVQSSYRVNQDTRQTREREINCQAKNVKMQTTAFQNKQSSGGLRGEHLRDAAGQPCSQNISWRPSLSLSFFFCFKYFTLFKYNDFLSDPTHQLFKVESRKPERKPFREEASLPCLPRVHHGSYTAGGLVAAGAAGDVILETIRHDNMMPAGMFQASLCRRVAEMRHK